MLSACQEGKKRERERIQERERGRKIKKHKNKEQGLGTIVAREEAPFFTSLKPLKKKEQRKTFHGYRISEEKEDEEGSLTEDSRTKHLLDCCHQD